MENNPLLKSQFEEAFKALQAGQFEDAETQFLAVLKLDPKCKEAYYHLGEVAQARKNYIQAMEYYEQVLAIDPEVQEVYNNLGSISAERGQTLMAIDFFFKALSINPDFALAHHNIGLLFCQQNQLDLGKSHFVQAVQKDPQLATHYYYQALTFLNQQYDAGACLYFDVLIQSESPLARQASLKKAYVHYRQLSHSEALDTLEQYTDTYPEDDTARVLKAIYQPMAYKSQAELEHWTARIAQELNKLTETKEPLKLPMMAGTELLHFSLAYQEGSCKNNLTQLGQLLQPHFSNQAPFRVNAVGTPVRVGVVSRFFYEHPVALSYLKLLQSFPQHAQVTLFALPGTLSDDLNESLLKTFPHCVALPPDLEEAASVITQSQIELLIYTDMGMDSMAYFLGLQRLALCQGVLSGHPVTSGLETLDFFVSSAPLETEDAQSHYLEPLVLLDYPNVNFPMPEVAAAQRSDFDLPEDKHLYVCPVTTLKLHPRMDSIFCTLLEQDPQAELIFFKDPSPSMFQVFQQRLFDTLTLELTSRVRFMDWLPRERFASFLSQCDVMLDSTPFGAGTTAYYAFAADLPIITWPGEHLKGRVVSGLYRLMDITEGVAHSQEDYQQKALTVVQDATHSLKTQINQRKHHLFSQSYGCEQMVVRLTDLVNQKRREHVSNT